MPPRSTSGALEISRYSPADRDELVALHRSTLAASGVLGPAGPWDDDLDDIEAVYLDSGGEFLVGRIGGEIVAMGAVRPLSALVVEVKRIRVAVEHQRRGYGTAILERLLDHARGLGAEDAILDTTTAQGAAISLFREHGFHETHRGTWLDFDVVFFRGRIVASAEDPTES